MAKPILIARVAKTTAEDLHRTRKVISESLKHEYHVFLVINKQGDEVTFETHNAENLKPVDVKELARLVNQHNETQTEA